VNAGMRRPLAVLAIRRRLSCDPLFHCPASAMPEQRCSLRTMTVSNLSTVNMTLIDIGANLTHDSFDHDREAVLQRARAAGVTKMIISGASREHSPRALLLAQTFPGELFATAGVHPHHATEYTDECDAEMRELHAHREVVAVGECGLDYNRDFSPRPAQRKAFERQLQLASENGKPIFLHQRDAHDDFIAMMKNFDGRLGPAVVHCFTGTRKELFDYLDQDWHIGITGWLCDERRGLHLRELVKHIPANRLMIETDAPYLLPRTVKPQPSHRRNEPMFLAHIAQELARDRGETVDVVAAATTSTATAFFRLQRSPNAAPHPDANG
jgi:TatD DNase family protein